MSLQVTPDLEARDKARELQEGVAVSGPDSGIRVVWTNSIVPVGGPVGQGLGSRRAVRCAEFAFAASARLAMSRKNLVHRLGATSETESGL
jgi:hypothetical protein